jgi:hypothetical protein
LRIAALVWLAGAALTYRVLVNGGFRPAAVAAKTSAFALALYALSVIVTDHQKASSLRCGRASMVPIHRPRAGFR